VIGAIFVDHLARAARTISRGSRVTFASLSSLVQFEEYLEISADDRGKARNVAILGGRHRDH
jgi:hypothetical protein